jgi:hypothetical protein
MNIFSQYKVACDYFLNDLIYVFKAFLIYVLQSSNKRRIL